MKTLWKRWRRARRLKKVPRRTFIVSTTNTRALHAARSIGLGPRDRDVKIVLSPRGIEGYRFLPGDRVVVESWPEHVHDVVHRGLIASNVGVKSRDLYVFEVIK